MPQLVLVYEHGQPLSPRCPPAGTRIRYKQAILEGWAALRPRPVCAFCHCEVALVEPEAVRST